MLLLVKITPPADASGTLHLKADANWLVCDDVCIPEDGKFALDLPVGATARPADADTRTLFDKARRSVPTESPWPARFGLAKSGDPTLEIAAKGLVESRGGTHDNPHLPARFVGEVERLYLGTRLARQELDGEMVDGLEGALWPRALIERQRLDLPSPREGWARVVVGVDPPAGTADGSGGDAPEGQGKGGGARKQGRTDRSHGVLYCIEDGQKGAVGFRAVNIVTSRCVCLPEWRLRRK